jgi:hypothetical protein
MATSRTFNRPQIFQMLFCELGSARNRSSTFCPFMHKVLINNTYISLFLVQVSPGAELAIVEAMKMRNVLRAEQEGIVKAVPAKVGSVLASDQVIIEFE